MKDKVITLDGNSLTIEQIEELVRDPKIKVAISESAYKASKKSKDYLDQHREGKIIYGVNTGFGPMASHVINNGQLEELQVNLIRSHASGVGDPIKDEYVLASMIVRLNTLAKGYSAVSKDLLDRLVFFINNRILPIVPEHGAVGTSGDLVQLAHIAQALIGEGEVMYQGERRPTSDVLKELKTNGYKLQVKEGLALINGTSVMSGVGALNAMHAERLLCLATRTGALALEVVHAFTDGISENLHTLRPHEGQSVIAHTLRSFVKDSELLRDRKILGEQDDFDEDIHELPDSVQEYYSIRCIPQILGPVYDMLKKTLREVHVEINAVTDNPIVDADNDQIYHGGNFHGDYIAASMDQLKMTLVKLTMLSERRINFFLNRQVNRHFPPFLNIEKPGLTLGLQGLQFVATSTASQSQTLAFPQYVHSIPTNADNQDIVSMGTDSALLVAKVIENAYIELAIEMVTLAQAVDYLGEQEKLSKESRMFYDETRTMVSKLTKDRALSHEIGHLIDHLKSGPRFRIQW